MTDSLNSGAGTSVRSRRRGRPRLRAEDRRDKRLCLRVSKSERDRIEILAQACSLSLPTYLRHAALSRKVRPAVPAVSRTLIDELVRLGRKLNQDLVDIYTRGYSPDLRSTLLELLALFQDLRLTLSGVRQQRGAAAP